MADYETVTIIYGSESGNTESVAEILAANLQKHEVKTTVKSVLDDGIFEAIERFTLRFIGDAKFEDPERVML